MRSKTRGMTLIEVLVAFVVLSMTLAVIMQIFSGGIRNARLAGAYSYALILAESQLAAVGVEQPLVVGHSSGQTGPDLRWHTTVELFDDGGAAERLHFLTRLYKIRAQVRWSDGERERQVELTTLRLGPSP